MEAGQNVYPLWKFTSEFYGFAEAFSLFGPYAGANIRMREIDAYNIETSMTLVPGNTNYVGTHFGGSLYSMCDPFFMFLLMRNLGPDYIVWDKAASIDFVTPGTGTVTARFHIPAEEIERIRAQVEKERKMDAHFDATVTGEDGKVVARVHKVLYVRRPMKSAAKSTS